MHRSLRVVAGICSLRLLAFLFVAIPSHLHSRPNTTTLTVTNTNDNGPGSLRQALLDANDGNTIQFDPALNGQTIGLTSGELVLDRNIAINGPGPGLLTVSRLSAPKFRFRIFHVMPGHAVTLQGLTISGGANDAAGGGGIYNEEATLNITNCSIQGNEANTPLGGGGIHSIGQTASLAIANSTVRNNTCNFGRGGGIHNNEGALTIAQSVISDNAAQFEYGGGIYNFGPMTINNSTITGNHSNEVGGGIVNDGTATLTDSVVSDNVAGAVNRDLGYGGAIYQVGRQGSILTIHRCTISGNSAFTNSAGGRGGGIYGLFVTDSLLIITESTINDNHADLTGGGINVLGNINMTDSTLSGNTAQSGGGLHTREPAVTIQNSTFSGNSSTLDGGAILNDGHVTIANSTISDNQAGRNGGAIYNNDNRTVEMTNTIFKAGASGANIFNNGGTVTSHGYNLSSDSGGGYFNAIGDQIDTNPILGPLQNNGGPTLTHELLPGSPAINVGTPNFTPPPLYDQRGAGYDRVFGGRIDIGSFEVQALLPTPTPSATPPVNGGIVFVSDRDFNGEIYRVDANGANPTNLTNNPASEYDPAWSPDGTKIAFTSNRDGGNPEIYVMDADGSNQVRLTNSGGTDRDAAWSPDGTRIAFASDRGGILLHIYVMNADGSNPIQLTDPPSGSDSEPTWSPNSAKIAFTSLRDANNREIYVMDANGANQINLTQDSDLDSDAHWSPDGTKIAFVSNRNGGFNGIYVMNANGSNQIPVTSTTTWGDANPAWSPDGLKLAFSTNRDGNNYEIYSINADGSNPIRLTNNPGFDERPDWGRVPSGAPSPTPSATASVSPPPTPSPTATVTATPTPMPTPTVTPSPSPGRALNISTRLRIQTGDNVLIGGFIVTGNAPKNVAVRGIGPSLAAVGINDPLADPTLELRAANGTLIVQNDNWQDNPAHAAQLTALGLALQHPNEPGIVATLDPGASYTAILAGNNGGTGIGLVEIYDIDQAADSQLANISTRGFVQAGDNVMIGGFILGGPPQAGNTGVVVRGIGPSLALIGLSPVLADPTLELRDSNGALLISNDDWQDNPASAAALTVRGLALQNPQESGIFASLPPGAFTAILSGENGGTGIGLVEIYNVH